MYYTLYEIFNMKICTILSLFLLYTSQIYSQGIDSIFDNTKYEAKLVITLDSVKKDEIFSRVKYWIGTTYKSASHVIDVEDKSSDIYRIILKPTMIKVCSYWGARSDVAVEYVVIIQIKDGKVKIEMQDFYLRGDSYNKIGNGALRDKDKPYGLPLKCWDEFYRWCKSDCIKLMVNFQDSIKKTAIKIEDDF